MCNIELSAESLVVLDPVSKVVNITEEVSKDRVAIDIDNKNLVMWNYKLFKFKWGFLMS